VTGAARTRLFRAPGRVNLIGDHTDYNDGLVLPIAIREGTFVAGRVRADARLHVEARDLGERAEVDLSVPWRGGSATWLAYVEGVARTLLARGIHLRGADLAIHSEVPMGAGLSSSAALSVGVALALTTLSGVTLRPVELARAAQDAEHRFAGARVGIMDPLVILLGRAGFALLLDCRSLETRHVPLHLDEHVLVLADSGVRHALASSGYNERRAECEEAASLLGLSSLRDVGLQDLPALQRRLPAMLLKRVRHVVTENARTAEAAEALSRGDFARMGALMLASHASLRDDYAVSTPELDRLVALTCRAGAAGARMTGGGFGGSVVALVRRVDVDGLAAEIAARLGAAIRVVEASDGAREIAGSAEEARADAGLLW
jgi:galactokinase